MMDQRVEFSQRIRGLCTGTNAARFGDAGVGQGAARHLQASQDGKEQTC